MLGRQKKAEDQPANFVIKVEDCDIPFHKPVPIGHSLVVHVPLSSDATVASALCSMQKLQSAIDAGQAYNLHHIVPSGSEATIHLICHKRTDPDGVDAQAFAAYILEFIRRVCEFEVNQDAQSREIMNNMAAKTFAHRVMQSVMQSNADAEMPQVDTGTDQHPEVANTLKGTAADATAAPSRPSPRGAMATVTAAGASVPSSTGHSGAGVQKKHSKKIKIVRRIAAQKAAETLAAVDPVAAGRVTSTQTPFVTAVQVRSPLAVVTNTK